MPTIKDVARRAGVAISTASAALNRSAPVSEDVVAKVEEAVRAIGYVPHGGAQSLRNGQSRLIGLIVPNIANPHFSAIARIVENVDVLVGNEEDLQLGLGIPGPEVHSESKLACQWDTLRN